MLEDKCRRHFKSISLGNQAFITDGPHGYHEVDEDSPIAMLTAKCAKKWFANRNDADTISLDTHNSNLRSSLEIDDLILSTRGTVGACAIVQKEALPSNIDQDVARIVLAKNADITPRYLLTYLNSRFGQDWITRNSTGMVQQGLSLVKVRELPIPLLPKEFQEKISKTVETASLQLRFAAERFEQAETTLLRALGLENWQAPEPLSYIRSSRDAFAAGRLDAEYFHPAKTIALATLDKLSDQTVSDIFDSIRELWQPTNGPAPATNLVRNYDLTDALNPFLDAAKEPVERAAIASTKKKIRAGDLVVSRLRSYLKEIAIVQPSSKIPMVASTEFIVLRPKSMSSLPVEALMIYLRSLLPQLVFKWSQDGSNHPRFDEKELLRLPVPRILIEQANDYVKTVRSIIAEREQATQLLDAAKRAVEIAIEDSEAAALAYCNDALSQYTTP